MICLFRYTYLVETHHFLQPCLHRKEFQRYDLHGSAVCEIVVLVTFNYTPAKTCALKNSAVYFQEALQQEA